MLQKALKNLSLIIAVFLVGAGVLVLLNAPKDRPEEVTLSTLVGEINQGEVQKITVQNNNLEIILKDGKEQKALKESESSLSDTLANYSVQEHKLREVEVEIKGDSATAVWAGAILPFMIPLIIIIGFIWFMMRQASRGNSQALSFGLSRARMLDPKDKKKRITFKDIAGSEESKEEFQEVVDFLKNPRKFLNIGAKIPKGVLLLGPPGTGKTLMAKAVAGEAGVPFFNISGSEFVEMFVGVGASRVRDLFKQAKKNAPSIVFIDEIDAVGRHRGAGLGGGHDEREQTLNQILVEMDGFETETNVIVIASTNRPDVLDPALLRPGRFDRRVTMDLPDVKDRLAILGIHAKNKPMNDDVNMERIAQRTPGFSGADLANLLNEAAILAARRQKKKVGMDELVESIEKVILGPERKSKRMSEKEKEIVAYHEAGHAIVGASLKNTDPVQKISIISRGSAGGYTMSVPTEDRHLYSRAHFVDELASLLGGYVSEMTVFGDVTTGPSNDLERATRTARNLVTRYGMSILGPRTFGKKEEMIFLGKEMSEEKDYSESTAQAIDREVSKFIDEAKNTAQEIVTTKRELLNKIANTLMVQETIEKEQFDAIMEGREWVEKKEEEKNNTETPKNTTSTTAQ
ncbi:MAG: ATP-dependent zinc metalloprotease FtsH [Candidatus Moranbacteria bacterium]|nr:ATP-dependent zinc metalloprotease FtsH [Candidatus Moranbacteria bacterium]